MSLSESNQLIIRRWSSLINCFCLFFKEAWQKRSRVSVRAFTGFLSIILNWISVGLDVGLLFCLSFHYILTYYIYQKFPGRVMKMTESQTNTQDQTVVRSNTTWERLLTYFVHQSCDDGQRSPLQHRVVGVGVRYEDWGGKQERQCSGVWLSNI